MDRAQSLKNQWEFVSVDMRVESVEDNRNSLVIAEPGREERADQAGTAVGVCTGDAKERTSALVHMNIAGSNAFDEIAEDAIPIAAFRRLAGQQISGLNLKERPSTMMNHGRYQLRIHAHRIKGSDEPLIPVPPMSSTEM